MREHEDEFELPEEIREGLRGLYAPGAGEGMEVARDARILAAARRAGESARWRPWRWAAVAAAVLVVMSIAVVPHGPVSPPTTTAYVRTGDIRDAFYVARELKARGAGGGGGGKALEATWDVNGDGVVDEKDVEALAAVAVRVERGTP